MLPCVTECCIVLQCVAVCYRVLLRQWMNHRALEKFQVLHAGRNSSVCCNMLQDFKYTCCNVFPCIAVYCSVLQCIAVYCSVLLCGTDTMIRTDGYKGIPRLHLQVTFLKSLLAIQFTIERDYYSIYYRR